MTTQNTQIIETAIKIALIALLAFSCYRIAAPFLTMIVWAGIIAIGVYPLYIMLKNKSGLSAGKSATLISLIMLVLFITPSYIISDSLFKNAQAISHHLKNDTLEIPAPPEKVTNLPLIGKKLYTFWNHAAESPKKALGLYNEQIKSTLKWITSLVGSIGLSMLSFIFSIIVAGIFLSNAPGVKKNFVLIFNRLAGNDRGEELTCLSRDTIKSVVTGILGIAFIQSTLAGLGFVAMGIPGAGVLTFICLVMAIIQIDILLVLIPLSVYAFSEYSTVPAIIFLIWNLVVGLSNNVMKPILLAKGVDAPMAIIFIGAIGGLMLSGIIGLFTGAVIMVLGYTLFLYWLKEDATSTNAGSKVENA